MSYLGKPFPQSMLKFAESADFMHFRDSILENGLPKFDNLYLYFGHQIDTNLLVTFIFEFGDTEN